jgi:hypothetical protein
VGLVVVVALLSPGVGTASPAGGGGRVSVIVQAGPGGVVAAVRLVERLGGRVGRRLG